MSDLLRAVLFDYGHTLINFQRPEAALLRAYQGIHQRLRERLGRPVPSADDLVVGVSHAVDDEIKRDYESGRLEELEIAQVYDACLRRLGLDLTPQLIEEIMEEEQEAWRAGAEVGPDAVPTLRRIRDAGLRVGLVSNVAFLPRLMRAQIEALGLLSYFDALTFSSEVGFRKPHPAIFTDALRRLAVPAAGVLFVGDRVKDDIQGARALGMRTVLLREWRQEEDPDGSADFAIERLGELWPLVDQLRRADDHRRASYN